MERAANNESAVEQERSPEWEAAHAAIDVARAADRRFMAGVEVRLAMLRQVRVLEEQGMTEEAEVVLHRVQEMQREEGIASPEEVA